MEAVVEMGLGLGEKPLGVQATDVLVCVPMSNFVEPDFIFGHGVLPSHDLIKQLFQDHKINSVPLGRLAILL